jgi:hypothetical protein
MPNIKDFFEMTWKASQRSVRQGKKYFIKLTQNASFREAQQRCGYHCEKRYTPHERSKIFESFVSRSLERARELGTNRLGLMNMP